MNAVVWFDRSQEEDWRIDSSASSLAAYREVVASSLYGGPNPAPALSSGPALAVESIGLTSQPGAHIATVSAAPLRTLKSKRARRQRLSYRLSRKAKLLIAVRTPRSDGGKTFNTLIRRATQRGKVGLRRLVRRHDLVRGTYHVTATAIGAGGVRSRPRHTAFRVRSR